MIRFVPSAATEDCLVNWFISVLHTLCENLSRKARTYEDQALSAIFLVNNYDHVLKHILGSTHIELFRRNDPKIDTRCASLAPQPRPTLSRPWPLPSLARSWHLPIGICRHSIGLRL